MAKEWKMAPIEPTEEMNRAGDMSYSWNVAKIYRAMLAAAPVPPAGGVQFVGYPPVPEDRKLSPAGDVEVFYMLRNNALRTQWRDAGKEQFDSAAGLFEYERRELVDRAHVTRLEDALDACDGDRHRLRDQRDGLLADLDNCSSMARMVEEREWAEHVGTGPVSSKVESAITQLHNDLHEVQSELTKARELLVEIKDYDISHGAKQAIETYLARQSAPAAKGEPRCNEERAELGLTTPPDCAACGRGSCFDR